MKNEEAQIKSESDQLRELEKQFFYYSGIIEVLKNPTPPDREELIEAINFKILIFDQRIRLQKKKIELLTKKIIHYAKNN